MFNLSEAFQVEYREFLSKEFDREINECNTQLEEAYFESQKTFKLIEEYFEAFALYEEENWSTAMMDSNGETHVAKAEDKDLNKSEKKTGASAKTTGILVDTIVKLVNNGIANDYISDASAENIHYKPDAMFTQVTKVSEMKFPQNIIYFVKGLISWIKNLVLAFINKIVNIVRRLFGLEPSKDKFDLNIKNYMAKSKTIENGGYEAVKSKSNKKIQVFSIPADEVKSLYEAEEMHYDSKDAKKTYALQIDISDDMLNLKTLVSHFFNIFDSSYGSNGEFLFGTDDVKLLLQIFVKSMEEIKSNNVPSYELQGRATELVAVDKDRLRVNLEKTLVNTEKLKKVYTEIVTRINNTLKLITHKQLLMSADMGVSFRFYSAATYQAMSELIDMMSPRIKDAQEMEKDLEKMKKTYEDLTIKFGQLQQSFGAISGITYQTIQQRTIRNLFDSARIMTQTITLRLTTLSLYLKALKDVREAIITANAVNESSKREFNKVFNFDSDIKKRFKKMK